MIFPSPGDRNRRRRFRIAGTDRNHVRRRFHQIVIRLGGRSARGIHRHAAEIAFGDKRREVNAGGLRSLRGASRIASGRGGADRVVIAVRQSRDGSDIASPVVHLIGLDGGENGVDIAPALGVASFLKPLCRIERDKDAGGDDRDDRDDDEKLDKGEASLIARVSYRDDVR